MWIHILVLLLVLFSLFSYSCNKKLTTWNFLSCTVLSIMTQTTEYIKLKIILLPSKSKSINAIACQLKEEKVRITCQTIAKQLVGRLPRHKVISHGTPVSLTACLNVSDNITQGKKLTPVLGGQLGQFPWILSGPSQNEVALDFL